MGSGQEICRFDLNELLLMSIVFVGESVLAVFKEQILYFGSVLFSQGFLFVVIKRGESVCLGGHSIIFFP